MRFGAALRLVATLRLGAAFLVAALRLVVTLRLVATLRLGAAFLVAVLRFGAALRLAVVVRLAVVLRVVVVRFAVDFLAVERFAVRRVEEAEAVLFWRLSMSCLLSVYFLAIAYFIYRQSARETLVFF